VRHSTLLSLVGLLGLLCQAPAHAANPRTFLGGSDAGVYAVRYAPDGKSLILVEINENKATIRRLERGTLKAIATRRIGGEWSCPAIAPNGEWLALAGVLRSIRIEIASGRQTDLGLRAGYNPVVAISNDSQFLAIRNSPLRDDLPFAIHIWSVQTGKLISTGQFGCQSDIDTDMGPMAFSPDGKLLRIHERLRTTGFASQLSVWDVCQSRYVRKIPEGAVEGSMAASLDGKLIALGSVYGEKGPSRIGLVETERYTEKKSLVGNGYPRIALMEFAPGGTRLVSCATDGWGLVRGTEITKPIPIHNHVRVWDYETGKEVASTELEAFDPWCIACSPDGTEIAFGGADLPPQPGPELKIRAVLKIWSPYEAVQAKGFREKNPR
jgi:WD40 repeat protein